MLKVKRANVVLRINDTEKQHYLDKGYSILDENGKVVEAAVPKNLAALKTKEKRFGTTLAYEDCKNFVINNIEKE